MKKNKDGTAAIPGVAWRLAAAVHLEAAESLATLLELDGIDSQSAIAKAIARVAKSHVESAKSLLRTADNTRPGRPKSTPANALMVLSSGKKARVGAPLKWGARYDITTFNLVEERRATLAATNKAKPTVENAVDLLNDEVAPARGRNALSYTKDLRNHTLSSYQRGKRLKGVNQNSK